MSQTVPATAVLGPGATGLTIGLRVLNLDGTTYAAFSTTGVAETSVAGTYRKAAGVACPDAGAYVVWGTAGTDYAEATVEPVTALSDIQARLPAALIGGRIDASVGAMAANALTAAALAADAGAEIATAVRSELAVELAHIDADISSISSGLTAQETRDAMKLAPTAGSPAAGSVDDLLGDIKTVTDAIDTSAVTVTTSNDAGALTCYRAVTFNATVSGLTISASWTKVYLTVKTDLDLADSASTIQVVETNPGAGTDGLLYLNGAAPTGGITYADAALVVTQAAGTVAITLSDNMTAQLERGASLHWDLKQIVSGVTSGVLASGTFDVALTPTRTI